MKAECNDNLRFSLNTSFELGYYELRCIREEHYAEVIFKKREAGEIIPATLGLSPDEAVALIDVLWRAGIRPSCGENHIGELNATKEHLKDMKAIAFNKLKITP